ncbi:hypothetical protein ACS0TY_008946 [Phlomoides rotata]
MTGLRGKSNSQVDWHTDVTEDDGLIIIPYNEIPDDWIDAPGISSYHSLDRNFVFPGEQVKLLVCLSANKHSTRIIAPCKNGIGQRHQTQDEKVVGESNPVLQAKEGDTDEENNRNGDAKWKIELQKDLSSESFLKMEDHRRQNDRLLRIFKNSHFFARIAESDEPLWSERSAQAACVQSSKNPISVVIDRGKIDSPTTGGVARGAAKCCSLSNGDIVVLLEVKVGNEFMRDPVLEILQFEKYHERNQTLENQKISSSFDHDPYGELLHWLLPLNNSRRPSSRPLSPALNSSSGIHHAPSAVSMSSGSELLSFGHVRSYSMPSLPPYKGPPQAITTPCPKPGFVLEDQYQFSFNNSEENENEGLLSFRGVSFVPGRFSAQCGLEGISTIGRRWRRKFELIQPLEIQSFSIDCNTDDLLGVHVKNVSPENAPDVVVFIDSVTIVYETALKSGPPLSLPIACTEAGNDYSLPNLAVRRGEEHSFILKPAKTLWRDSKGQADSKLPPRRSSARKSRTSWHPSLDAERRHGEPPAGQYAVLLSCRCNYTDSKLFFKHPTSWQPRIARDLMISVASGISRRTMASDGTQLPVQVLTLQASNMTSDDLTLTVRDIHDQPTPLSDVVQTSDLSGTHLWLQSRVPLGCVPSQSTTTTKLELLPLTDGIINLDSLQIDVMEKGVSYMPKHVLKINATRALPLL